MSLLPYHSGKALTYEVVRGSNAASVGTGSVVFQSLDPASPQADFMPDLSVVCQYEPMHSFGLYLKFDFFHFKVA